MTTPKSASSLMAKATQAAASARVKRAEEMRLVADYNGGSVQRVDASELLKQAELFVQAMHGMTSP
jgi:hypothetical protein